MMRFTNTVLLKLFGRRAAVMKGQVHTVTIIFECEALAGGTLRRCDTSALEKEIQAVMGDAGECDWFEQRPAECRLHLRGPDANSIFSRIEGVLRQNPLTAQATAVLRKGGVGAPEQRISVGKLAKSREAGPVHSDGMPRT